MLTLRNAVCCFSLLILSTGWLTGISRAQNQSTRRKSTSSSSSKVYSPGEFHLEKSRVYILVGKTGLGHEHGVEGKIKAGSLDLHNPDEGGSIEFDMHSFSADTEAARKHVGLEGSTDASTREQVNRNMLGKDVLDVNRHPTAKFKIDTIRKLPKATQSGQPQYELNGRFTLHGKTHPLKVAAVADEKGNWTRLRGKFSILQSDYGITPFSKAFGAIGVADKLWIWGDFWIAGHAQPNSP